MLRLLMGKVVLSLRPGDGDTFTRWLNEARRKINGINMYIMANTQVTTNHYSHRHDGEEQDFMLLSCI